MDPLRLHALLIGLPCGHALTRWVGMGGAGGECLTWYVLSTTSGSGRGGGHRGLGPRGGRRPARPAAPGHARADAAAAGPAARGHLPAEAHKYGTGLDRIAAGRLHQATQALGVGADHLFEGAAGGAEPAEATQQQRRMIELVRDFAHIPEPRAPEGALRPRPRDPRGGGGDRRRRRPRDRQRRARLTALSASPSFATTRRGRGRGAGPTAPGPVAPGGRA